MLQSCWKIVDYSNIVRYLDSSWFQKLFILYHWRTLAYKIFEWNCDNRSDWNYPIGWWQIIEIDNTIVVKSVITLLLLFELWSRISNCCLFSITVTYEIFEYCDKFRSIGCWAVNVSLRLVIECDVFVIWNTRSSDLRHGWMKVRWFLDWIVSRNFIRW